MTKRSPDRRSGQEGGARRRGTTPKRPERARDRTEVAERHAAPDSPALERVALAAWSVAAALTLARALLAFVPSMWAWSLGLLRFLDLIPGWGLWLLGALPVIPAVARRLEPWARRAGDAATRAPVRATLAWMAVAAVLVLLLPDRVRFVGDFLLRQGTVEEMGKPAELFPQALPLDVLIHHLVPSGLVEAGFSDANGIARAFGAIEAALLAALAVAFARECGLRGVASFAATSIVLFGGALGMFTGFSKAFRELVVIAVALSTWGLAAMRRGAHVLAFGIALAAALALHRSALGFLPAAVAVWIVFTRSRSLAAWRAPDAAAGLLLPLGVLAWLAPRILATVTGVDAAVHFAPAEVKENGGFLASLLTAPRLADELNLAVLLVPLVPAVPFLLPALRGSGRGREAGFLALLLLPFVLVALAIHPAQGLFRDWDDFAALGALLAVFTGWLAGESLRRAPRHAWVGVALAAATVTPTVQWLAHQVDIDRGLARVEAFLTEPPPRTPPERGKTWDYLGIRNYRLQRHEAAARAFGRASETSPSPRILMEWALASSDAGDLRGAQAIYHRVLARDSANVSAWFALASVSSRLDDLPETRRATERILALQPGNATALRLMETLDRVEAARRDSLAARGTATGGAPAPR